MGTILGVGGVMMFILGALNIAVGLGTNGTPYELVGGVLLVLGSLLAVPAVGEWVGSGLRTADRQKTQVRLLLVFFLLGAGLTYFGSRIALGKEAEGPQKAPKSAPEAPLAPDPAKPDTLPAAAPEAQPEAAEADV